MDPAALRANPAQVTELIEHTNVDPTATTGDIRKLCADVRTYGFRSAVVVPYHAELAASELGDTAAVATVIGFPYGVQTADAKVAEVREIKQYVDEFDMVMHRTAFANRDDDRVVADVEAVCDAAGDRPVKCIIESPTLDPPAIEVAAELVEAGGAAFVKTAVGYDGPTQVDEIERIAAAIGPDTGIKASGGIASFEDVLAMVEAGATRIGTSSGVDIVDSI